MNQSVRPNEADMDNILSSLLNVAARVAPHSPELDRLVESIGNLQLPSWRPSNAAHQVHDQRHHEKLGEIISSISPKIPTWKRWITKNKIVEAPKTEILGATLIEVDRYIDATALSFQTIEREEQAMTTVMHKMTIISHRLNYFQEALSIKTEGQVFDFLNKAVEDKKNDIVINYAAHNYTKGAFFMARHSLEISAEQASLLRKAITLAINVRKSGIEKNRMKTAPLPGYQRKRDPNHMRLREAATPPTAAEKLATLAAEVSEGLIHQQKAIDLMEETSKSISRAV